MSTNIVGITRTTGIVGDGTNGRQATSFNTKRKWNNNNNNKYTKDDYLLIRQRISNIETDEMPLMRTMKIWTNDSSKDSKSSSTTTAMMILRAHSSQQKQSLLQQYDYNRNGTRQSQQQQQQQQQLQQTRRTGRRRMLRSRHYPMLQGIIVIVVIGILYLLTVVPLLAVQSYKHQHYNNLQKFNAFILPKQHQLHNRKNLSPPTFVPNCFGTSRHHRCRCATNVVSIFDHHSVTQCSSSCATTDYFGRKVQRFVQTTGTRSLSKVRLFVSRYDTDSNTNTVLDGSNVHRVTQQNPATTALTTNRQIEQQNPHHHQEQSVSSEVESESSSSLSSSLVKLSELDSSITTTTGPSLLNENEFEQRKNEWASKYTSVAALRQSFGKSPHGFWGDLDVVTTRRLYKTLLPRALLALHCLIVTSTSSSSSTTTSIDGNCSTTATTTTSHNAMIEKELAPLAYQARVAAKLYARERCVWYWRIASNLYDGIRQFFKYGTFNIRGISYQQLWNKYALDILRTERYRQQQDETNTNHDLVVTTNDNKQQLPSSSTSGSTKFPYYHTNNGNNDNDHDAYEVYDVAGLKMDDDFSARICLKILEKSCQTNPDVDRFIAQQQQKQRQQQRQHTISMEADLHYITEQLDADVRRLLGQDNNNNEAISPTTAIIIPSTTTTTALTSSDTSNKVQHNIDTHDVESVTTGEIYGERSEENSYNNKQYNRDPIATASSSSSVVPSTRKHHHDQPHDPITKQSSTTTDMPNNINNNNNNKDRKLSIQRYKVARSCVRIKHKLNSFYKRYGSTLS